MHRHATLLAALAVLLAPAALAGGDAVVPAEVAAVAVAKGPVDLTLTWQPVTLDASGQPETVAHYTVYRGTAPRFPVGWQKVGTTTAAELVDPGAAASGSDFFYVVTATDVTGHEGAARPSPFLEAPALTGFWTPTSIELGWTPAEPQALVAGYRVYFGERSRQYTASIDTGTLTSLSLGGLLPNRNYFAAVVALDAEGRESPLSNEHVDALAGTIDLKVHDLARLCPFDACPPPPGTVQRRGGQELMVPVEFPEGDWTNITVTYTVESRLCVAPIAPDKCGDQNPGWNPCGDPWDRTASVFLVLNDCVETGAGCYASNGNLELLRAITPFGTDAEPPEGTGVVGPAVWTLDITPFRPVLTGTKHVGAYIATWVAPGWLVSVDFHFSKDPLEASPKPPAAGVAAAWFRDGGESTVPNPVTIPADATSVKVRAFMTGHGGVLGAACECSAQGRPCDEFCTKAILFKVNGATKTSVTPWRTDCSPLGEFVCGGGSCQQWNACGCPSCTYNRAGWCPGFIACHHNAPCDQDLEATSWFTPGATHNVLMSVRAMTAGASWANSLAVFWY